MPALIAFLCILAQFGAGVPSLAAPRASSDSARAKKKRIRPSEIRLPPLPRPTPKPPRIRGVKTTPKSTEALALNPKPQGAGGPSSSFVLSKVKAGKLRLQFHSEKAGLEFDPSEPFVIQLNPEGTLRLNPSAFTRPDWSKGARQVELSYEGASRKQENLVLGEAAYTVCPRGSKKGCRKEKTPIVFRFR